MAFGMHARLLRQGCRLLVGTGTQALSRAHRQAARSVLVTAEWQQRGERGASTRLDGRRGGGGVRRSDRPPKEETPSIWGDSWDTPAGKSAGESSSGWLDAAGESNDARDSGSGRSGGRFGRGDRASGGRASGGRGEWHERGSGAGRGSGPSREGDAAGGAWEGGTQPERDAYASRAGDRRENGSGYQRGGYGGGRGAGVERSGRGQGGGGGGARWGDRREERSGGRWEDREGGDRAASRGGERVGRWEGRSDASRGGGRWEDRGRDRWGEGRPREAPEEEEEQGPSGLRQFWVGDVLYGVSPVLAALQAGRRTAHTLYLQEGMDLAKRKDKGAIQTVKRLAGELGAAVEYASKHDLNMVADNRPHQGVVLDCSALAFEPLDQLPAASGAGQGGRLPVWLCLDEVMDPQNFGAALRVAYYLGAAGVLTCHRNSAPLSAVVSKASSGAMELLPVHTSKNLPATLAAAKSGGWMVLGASAEAGARGAAGFVLDRPALLVMGNEGYGLRTTVRRLCDAMLQIDDGGAARKQSLVDSLNVSVATGILLHRLLTAQAPSCSGAGAADTGAGGGEAAEIPAEPVAAE